MAGFFFFLTAKSALHRHVLFRTYLILLLDYLLTIGTTNRNHNSEGIA